MNLFKKNNTRSLSLSKGLVAVTMSSALMLAACGDDSSSSSTAPESNSGNAKKYGLAFMTDKSMLVGTGSLSEKQGDLVKDFIEASNSGGITYSDGSLYLVSVDEAMTSTLSRYELDEEGNLPEKPAATTKFEGTGAMMVKFADKNKLYVNQTFANSIVAVDAKTLKTTATIDLSEYLEDGAQMIGPGSSVIRDGKLFLSMGQLVDAQSMIGGPQASVAVIDVKTDKVEKVINSSLVSAVGVYDDMNNTMSFVDEDGDVYFYAPAAMGWMEGYEEGWIRIKKGETEFDKDWVFHLHDAAYDGEKSNENYLMTGGTYLGKGKFLGFFGHFADPSNFYAYEWSFVVIDLKKKTVEKIPGLAPTIPWFAPSIHLDTDGTAFIGHADEKSGAIYRYDVESGKLTKEMDVSTGTAYYIIPLED